MNKRKINVRSITLTAMLLSVLVVQEEVLMFIPNVQLTAVLIMAYAAVLPLPLLLMLVSGYVIIDGMIMGTVFSYYTVPMLFSWLLLALIARAVRNRPFWVIVIIGVAHAFIYSWSFIPVRILEQGIGILWPYFMADLPFEVMLAATNLVTVFLFYRPFRDVLEFIHETRTPHKKNKD
jgi:hypothetical protein